MSLENATDSRPVAWTTVSFGSSGVAGLTPFAAASRRSGVCALGPSNLAPSSIHFEIAVSSAGVTFGPARGMSPEVIKSTNRLPLLLPGRTTMPSGLPFIRASNVAMLNLPLESLMWQRLHFDTRIGAMFLAKLRSLSGNFAAATSPLAAAFAACLASFLASAFNASLFAASSDFAAGSAAVTECE